MGTNKNEVEVSLVWSSRHVTELCSGEGMTCFCFFSLASVALIWVGADILISDNIIIINICLF